MSTTQDPDHPASPARHSLLHPAGYARRIVRWGRRLAWILLLPVLLLGGWTQWWLLPRLNDYRVELAGALSQYLQLPVQINALTAAIEDGQLALRLQGVSLHATGRDATLARFARAAITFNLWRSLHEGRPIVGRVRLEGASLELDPDALGGSGARPDSATLAETARWLSELQGLDIVGDRLAVRLPDGSALQLHHPYLRLQQAAQGPQLTLTAELPKPLGEHLEITAGYRTVAADWQVQGRVYSRNPSGQTQVPMEFAALATATGWQGSLRHWRAEQALQWAKAWLAKPAQQWLTALDPQGGLPEIEIQRAGDVATVTARLRDLRLRPAYGLPGLTNVTGQLHITPQQGRLDLDSRAVQVDTAGLLRAPITFTTLSGAVQWRREADRLQLDSTGLELANPDLTGHFAGRVIVPDRGEPWLDIQGRYQNVKVGRARHYLPVAVIPPEGVAWLDRALVSGRVVSGELTFRGPPAAFPFDRNEGLFETGFQVEDAVLDYGPGWPRLERLKTRVVFRNRSLTVEAQAGRLLDGELENATARIDDLSEVVVQVKGRAKGPAASMWRALKDSPLGKTLGDDLPDVQASGNSNLDLELTVPTDARPAQTRGRVELLDNALMLPAWALQLERVRGEVRFTESSLDSRNIQARWRGEPIRLDLELVGRDGRHELRSQIQGRLGLAALVSESAQGLAARISGKSDWTAVLTVPTGQDRRRGAAAFRLELDSDLRGTAINLPEPFAKSASERRPLHLLAQPVASDRLTVHLDYGADTRLVLALRGPLKALQMERGELRIGAGEAHMPDPPGLTVIARLPRWSWNGSLQSAADAPERSPSPLIRLHRLDARIDDLKVAGHRFGSVVINATRYDQGLSIDLDGATLAGRLTVPDEPTPQRPVNAALERLYLRYTPSERVARKTQPDPRQIPPLVFTATGLRINDRPLGRLRFVTQPYAQGLRVADLELNAEQQRLVGSGAWQWNGSAQVSQVKATLYSAALGTTLATFGYADTGVVQGETGAELAVEWAGSPADFALEHLSGTLNFHMGPGQLLSVNPGLGRMVGLFNVQNLGRRLKLDFSDVLEPGASFDRISGDLLFAQGQARTDNLTLEGPAARIEVHGRVGLKDRDYDQRITVTPSLGGTLPIAGVLAGGPVTGAAVFVAERLLQKTIERVTRYQYRLHGSWQNPLLEPVTEPSSPAVPRLGFNGDH